MRQQRKDTSKPDSRPTHRLRLCRQESLGNYEGEFKSKFEKIQSHRWPRAYRWKDLLIFARLSVMATVSSETLSRLWIVAGDIWTRSSPIAIYPIKIEPMRYLGRGDAVLERPLANKFTAARATPPAWHHVLHALLFYGYLFRHYTPYGRHVQIPEWLFFASTAFWIHPGEQFVVILAGNTEPPFKR